MRSAQRQGALPGTSPSPSHTLWPAGSAAKPPLCGAWRRHPSPCARAGPRPVLYLAVERGDSPSRCPAHAAFTLYHTRAPRTNPSCTPQPPLITSAQESRGVPPKHNHRQPAGRGLVPGWGCRGISGFVFLGAAEHTSRLS